jgi:OOP family OmpA-OmpF porin
MRLSPLRPSALLAFAAAVVLAACQSVSPISGFTPAQIAMLESEGFVETGPAWELTISERLLFPVDESALKPDQQERIARLARNLLSVDILTARVEGHTDSTGTSAYNQALSQARAHAVATPMQANGMRFNPEQIVGRGEAFPLSSNDTAEGRQDNRRVVVIVAPE